MANLRRRLDIIGLSLQILLTLLLRQSHVNAFIVAGGRKVTSQWIVSLRSGTNGDTTPEKDEDPFELFDPRLSPHMYPSGIPSAPTANDTATNGVSNNKRDENNNVGNDPFESFDPRVSPHMYPNGIPDDTTVANGISASSRQSATESTTTSATTVGILIIDHGSRRTASNEHLHRLAAMYQDSTRCPNHFVVRAAHMEIAPPSIKDGIDGLISLGASRIVCHPYFLSPGRHATEDVPRLIDEAVRELECSHVPIVTTDPIGTNVNVLVNAIGDLVEEEMRVGFPRSLDDDGLGMFGDIMRMMENMD